ncbi:DUF1552 domain-containing protein [Planctomyces sp. SH-PL14]|uniref:DUF1552 domain-containing protein n=1 Tax=Planctomyces sp. SH-PL14 TaxID=1632864 RepID=UPI00078CC724|nr:DUF1552 domain-containing protein [Planctomyces sp. SH-PL14]AMV22535.1 hypothetical protein VT03_31860 [Planctomyces sp. SH-PL14]
MTRPLPLRRRTFLRGAGALLALPWLEGMLPKAARAAAAASPLRVGFVFFPNGAIMPDWTPTSEGTGYELSKTLAPLAPVKDQLLVVSGLAHDKARANGDGAGDHARSCAAFLTGAQPRKTSGDIRAGQSIDQFIAERIGHETRLPSLELGIEGGRQAGSCDSGYSCAYSNSVSWKSASTPMGKETNPRSAFDRLFGQGADAKARAERDFYRKSILDSVAADTQRLTTSLGQSDRRKLDEYLTSVREVEQRIERADAAKAILPPEGYIPPKGIPEDLVEHIRLMYDLLLLAFQTDTTRVATFMVANEGSNRVYKSIGLNEGHHQMSHHRNDPDKVAKLQQIDQFQIEQFAAFLSRLRDVREGEHSLLDQSLFVYGCAISDGNRHRHEDLPILVAGGGAGTVRTGRHVRLRETPTTNLFLSLADRMGIDDVDSFGDSTGRLGDLA